MIQDGLVVELTTVAHKIRAVGFAQTSQQRKELLEESALQLAATHQRWDRPDLGLSNVARALGQQHSKLLTLSQSDTQSEQFPRIAYAAYLSLENIASQLSASIEQELLERGETPTRVQLLNQIIQQRGITSYLEIGCCNNACFDAIACPQKVGVDPTKGGTLRMTSDAFFEVNQQVFGLIFIDGLHESWQVDKDIVNALTHSAPNAVIVLHDCNPLFEVRSIVPRIAETWNGDVWKSLVRIRSRSDLDCSTGIFDHGCAVICKRPNSDPLPEIPEKDISWPQLEHNRQRWLRLMPYQELVRWIG
jgi:predicted O-methyltransferase YrrM